MHRHRIGSFNGYRLRVFSLKKTAINWLHLYKNGSNNNSRKTNYQKNAHTHISIYSKKKMIMFDLLETRALCSLSLRYIIIIRILFVFPFSYVPFTSTWIVVIFVVIYGCRFLIYARSMSFSYVRIFPLQMRLFVWHISFSLIVSVCSLLSLNFAKMLTGFKWDYYFRCETKPRESDKLWAALSCVCACFFPCFLFVSICTRSKWTFLLK